MDTNPEGTNAKYVALFTDTHIRMYPNPISEDELGTAHNYELDIDLKTCGGISLNQTSVSIGTKINRKLKTHSRLFTLKKHLYCTFPPLNSVIFGSQPCY